MNFETPIPIELSTFIRVSEDCLADINIDGRIEHTIENVSKEKIVFKLRQRDLGDIGLIELSKETDRESNLLVKYPPITTNQDVLSAEVVRRDQNGEPVEHLIDILLDEHIYTEEKTLNIFENLSLSNFDSDEQENAIAWVSARLDNERKILREKRIARHKKIIQDFFMRLLDHSIWEILGRTPPRKISDLVRRIGEETEGDSARSSAKDISAHERQDASIETPGRDPDFRAWCALWKKIKPKVIAGKSTSAIVIWVKAMGFDLPSSRATITKVIKAGQAGLLD